MPCYDDVSGQVITPHGEEPVTSGDMPLCDASDGQLVSVPEPTSDSSDSTDPAVSAAQAAIYAGQYDHGEAAQRKQDAAVDEVQSRYQLAWMQGNPDAVEAARQRLQALGEDPGPAFDEVAQRADAKREWEKNVAPRHDELIARFHATYDEGEQKKILAQLAALPADPG